MVTGVCWIIWYLTWNTHLQSGETLFISERREGLRSRVTAILQGSLTMWVNKGVAGWAISNILIFKRGSSKLIAFLLYLSLKRGSRSSVACEAGSLSRKNHLGTLLYQANMGRPLVCSELDEYASAYQVKSLPWGQKFPASSGATRRTLPPVNGGISKWIVKIGSMP